MNWYRAGGGGENVSTEVNEQTTTIEDIQNSILNKGSEVNVTAADVLSPKTLYINGTLTTGTLEKQEKTVSSSTEQQIITPSEGKLLDSVTIEPMTTGELNTPTISSSGLITSSVGTSGYIADSATKTLQLSTQAATTITPGTSSKTAVASNVYTTGDVTVAGDSNLVASNILSGKSIFGVSGILEAGANLKKLFGLSYMETGNYTFTSDVSVNAVFVSHSLGVAPQIVLAFEQGTYSDYRSVGMFYIIHTASSSTSPYPTYLIPVTTNSSRFASVYYSNASDQTWTTTTTFALKGYNSSYPAKSGHTWGYVLLA